ncbi:hypothetical protein FSP39_010314 [Pinctada imbricata]|uniref:Uncharacterized protein n=1 Tax=Pinctada imbricata TaxID=66713 RepID=A0AA88Y3Q2_PINIB|nr:hypothetical protein FSP39_010314 [Pinctada imbricata]
MGKGARFSIVILSYCNPVLGYRIISQVMDVLNENSNTTGLDLYDDILISEGIQKQQTNDELQQKYSEAQARITELEIELEQTKNSEKHYKQLTESVTNNLSSLLVTAKAEISRKDTIIKSLRSQIDNLKHDGGLKGALRRSHREHRCYDRVEDLYHDRPANGHDKEPSPSKTSKRESRERESDDRLRKQDADRNRNRTESGRRKRKVLSEEEESDVQIKKSKHDYSKRASETPARSVQHFHCERSRDGFDSARKLVEKSKRQLLRRKSNDNKNEGFNVKQSESKRESSFSAGEDSFSGRTVEIVKIDRNSSKKHISVPRKTKDESSDSDASNRKRERSRTKPKLEGRKEKDREKLDNGESSSRGKPSKPESREKDKERRPRSKKEDGWKDEEYKIDRSKTSKDGNDDNRVKEKLQSQESSPFKSIVCDDSKASRGKNGEKQSDNKVDVSNNDQSSVGGRKQQDDSLEKKSEVDDLRQKITLKRKNRQSSSSDKSSPERTKTETPSPKKRVVISPIRFFSGSLEKTNIQREVTPYKDVPLTLPLICSTKSDTSSSKNALHHPDSHIETKINEIEEGVGPTKSENCTSAKDGKTSSFSNVALENEITKRKT